MQSAVLITGGAGYIGSHIAYLLARNNYQVIILDNFVHNQIFQPSWATVIKKDYADAPTLETIFSHYPIKAVIHCAASIEIGQSVRDPLFFYENNVGKTITLLQTMLKHGINTLLFSSSCAVYGIPLISPLAEDHSCNPINPYGRTKHMVETIIHDAHQAYGLRYALMRYFNVAGSLAQEGLGEQHTPETHLIPLLIRSALHKIPFTIFGNEYPTKDGTPLRDYIHVLDVAHAHVAALAHLMHGNPSDVFNVGTGFGYSIKEIISIVENVCNTQIIIRYGSPRSGDAPILVANPSKANTILSWQPRYSDISFIIQSALAYYMNYQDHFSEQHSSLQSVKN